MAVTPSLPFSLTTSLDEPSGPGFERHFPELDGIRGLAALAVVFYHVALYVRNHTSGPFGRVLNVFLLGDFGVDIFFVLSGFLITRILLKRRGQRHYFRHFYARRFLRLAPPYVLILILVATIIPGSGRFILLSLVYLANMFAFFHVDPSYGSLWTLSVEEHFYLLWPALIWHASKRSLGAVLAFICIGTPCLRLYEAYHGGFNPFLTWYRLDGLAWGAALAFSLTLTPTPAEKERLTRWARRSIAAVGLFLGVVGVGYRASGQKDQALALFFSSIAMLTAVFISNCIEKRHRGLAFLRSRLLRFFGDISYWLYLIHLLILLKTTMLLERFAPRLVEHGGISLWLACAIPVFGISVLSGVAVRKWIELPALRRKARFSGN